MKAHYFHQHLIGIGRSIEGTCAGAVIALSFGFEQFVTSNFALGKELANAGLFWVGEARGHGTCWTENCWQPAKAQRADQQARHNLVAYAKANRGIECIVRQGDGCAHGNNVTRIK